MGYTEAVLEMDLVCFKVSLAHLFPITYMHSQVIKITSVGTGHLLLYYQMKKVGCANNLVYSEAKTTRECICV